MFPLPRPGLFRWFPVVAVLLAPLAGVAKPFGDSFESDTSGLYTGSDSFGSGGTFAMGRISGLLEIEAAAGNTYLAMLDDGEHFLEVGEFLEVISGSGVGPSSPHQYVVVSNTNVQPSADEGFRFRRSPSLRIQGGTAPGASATLAEPPYEDGISYRIERPTDTAFRFLYDAGEGWVDLGLYDLSTAASAMHVGVQAWQGTTSFESLTIGILADEENVAPTDIVLSGNSVRVGASVGTSVGDLRVVDPNPGDSATFELVSVNGEADSEVFEIVGGELRTSAPLTSPAVYAVEIRATDSGGLTHLKAFSVTVDTPLAVFGAVADVQYADKPTSGARDYRGSVARLQDAVNFFNTQSDLDFVVSLGDFIDDGWLSFDTVVPIWDQLLAPETYHVLGNHDFTNVGLANIPRVADRLGMPAPYYSFEIGQDEERFQFIVLDGQELATFTTRPGTPERAAADVLRARAASRGGNGFDWNGGVGPAQFEWLRNQLDVATDSGTKVIIFCHYPIVPLGAAHNTHTDHELKALVEQYPVVKLWMNGHQHGGAHVVDEGVHFLTLRGMVEQQGSNAFAVCELFGDRLEVSGFGSEPDRTLEFSASREGAGPIDSFDLSATMDTVAISWPDLNQGETGYAIERRRLGGGDYLRVTTTGPDETTYMDSGFAESGTYRYRIAALTEEATGAWSFHQDVGVRLPIPRPFQIFEVERDRETNSVSLKWPSEPGELFLVERSADLVDWIPLNDSYPAAESGVVTEYIDSNWASRFFYRVTNNEPAGGGDFLDDFETDSSGDYTSSDAYGSGGAFFVSTETGTLELQAGGGNTHTVMLDDGKHFLEAGEYLEVVTTTGVGSSSPHQFVVVSNTAFQPAEFEGFRFRRSPSLRIWGGDAPGASTTLADPDRNSGLTYRIERLSATEFRFLFELEPGSGFTDLGTYNLPAAEPRMHVGMQGWAGLVTFDRLTIGSL